MIATINHTITAGIVSLLIIFCIGLTTLLGVVALITYVIKIVWYGEKRHKQYRKTKKPRKISRKRNNLIIYKPKPPEPKWYPSGWIFNEVTQLWDPPDYIDGGTKNTNTK